METLHKSHAYGKLSFEDVDKYFVQMQPNKGNDKKAVPHNVPSGTSVVVTRAQNLKDPASITVR
jgi:hypothetical protein